MNYNHTEVQKFLDTIQKEVEQSGEQCGTVSFAEFWDSKYSANDTSFHLRAYLSDVAMLQNINQISYYRELTSYKKGPAKIVIFVKRIIRKLVAFLFLPIVESQNAVNASVSRIAIHLRAYVNRDNTYRNGLLKREKELEMQVERQRDMIHDLSMQLADMQARLDSLEKGGTGK